MFPIRSTAAFAFGLCALLWWITPPLTAAADATSEFLALVNRERETRHLIPLAPSADLARVARRHGLELVQRGEIDHTNQAGQSPLDRVRAADIDGFSLLAENLGRTTVRGNPLGAILSGWLDSPVHRENLLNPAFNTSGLAILESPSGETFVVELYATF